MRTYGRGRLGSVSSRPMILHTFVILLPLFVICAGGFLMDRLFSLSEDTLVRAVSDFFFPLLVFSSLYASEINGAQTARIFASTVVVAAILFGLSYLYCHVTGRNSRELVPPLVFMNSGFLGIPLMKLLGGSEAMNLTVIFDPLTTFIIFTMGIIVVSGGFSLRGVKEMVKSPLLWAIGAGFLFRFLRIPLPEPMLQTMDFGASAASALAVFTLGCSLSKRKLELDIHIAAGFLIRTVGGFFVGVVAVRLLSLSGAAAQVVIVASALPSAVFSFVLPLRYGVKPQYAGSLVFVSTVLGIVTVPLSISLAEFFIG